MKFLLVFLFLLLSPQLHADDSTDEVIQMVSGCLKIGGYALDALEPLGAIADVGSTVLHMVGVLHHNDPVMKKLDELNQKLDMLAQQMTQQFNELKAFMVAEIFYAEFAQTSSMLRRFMLDTITNPCAESIRLFHLEYTKNAPMEYIYRLLSMLEIPDTNPLMMAMNADPLRTNATFQKWRAIIDAVSTEFLFIETYANGLFNNQTMYEPNTMKGRLVTLHQQMDGWKQNYMNTYWPNIVQQLMYDTQDHYAGGRGGVSNAYRAQVVRDTLKRILTDDAFVIMSYDPCSGNSQHVFYTRNSLTSFQRGKSNMVVFRSRQWKNTTVAHQNEFIKNATDEMWSYHMPCEKDYSEEPSNLLSQIPNAAGVGIVRQGNNLAIEYVNNADYGLLTSACRSTIDDSCKHPTYFDAVVVYN